MINLNSRVAVLSICLIFFTAIASNLSGQTLHLKPGASDGVDAYLDQNTGNNNYGTHSDYAAISWNCSPSCNARGVLRFAISSIPANAVITSATLSLWANPNATSLNPPPMKGANESVLQRITSNWNESTVTWNSAPSTTNLHQVTLAQSTTGFQDYLNIDVTALVQDMVNDPATSFGFMLRLTNETPLTAMTFASSDYFDASKHPEITINYQIPGINTSALNRSVFCPGSPVTINFISSASFAANNTFVAQLSNSSGSFANPVNIGVVNSSTVTPVSGTIPANTLSGNGYRIRVISTNPSIVGSDNGSNLTVSNVSDNNPCTIDVCDLSTGIVTHSPVIIDDNNVCTVDACNLTTGQVTHTPLSFEDNNACTTDGCNPVTGIFHTPVNINDNNACTTDFCDPVIGTLHSPIAIPTDNNPCTNDVCDPLTGNFNHPAININDNNACTSDACDQSTGNISHNIINANDNNACTFDGCDYINGIYHNPVNIDDGNQCTFDACDPANGNISHLTIPTNDNNACTIDGCDNVNGVYHTPVSVDDQNACTNDACDALTGNIMHIIINSNDNNLCTFDGCDFITGVFHIATATDDQNACTNDVCDPATGQVTHALININDNNGCTTDGCDYITGVYHTPAITNDNNACTNDVCDPATGQVSHALINTNDNNGCTTDGCDFITGVFHTPAVINDNNACTDDACDISTGVISHTTINSDDNSLCTFDGCDYITGVYHISVNTDDGNPCTEDVCEPSSGIITHGPANTDDNNLCTNDGCDPVTGIYHNSFSVDDFNPCTEDGCDSYTGIYHYDHTPQLFVTYDPIKCYGDETCINVVALGGVTPYSGDGMQCNYTAGSHLIEVIDGAGCGAFQYLSITQPNKLNVNVNAIPPTCGNNNGSITASASGGTPPYTYLWMPGLDTSSTIAGLGPGIYSATVTDANNCMATVSTTMTAIGFPPSAPGTVSGPSGACRSASGIVYSVSSVSGASSYAWTLPAGVTGMSNTNSITLSFSNSFSGGFLCVKAVNGCGSSASTCKNISRVIAKPGSIAQISGLNKVCLQSVVTYCIPSVANATNYIWSFAGNGGSGPLAIISGQGTTCVTVNVPSGYNGNQKLRVKAENCLGVSGSREEDIHKTSVPNAPGNISGAFNVCKSQSYAYSVGSVGGATSYIWTITGGATINSGQGTRNIIINFNSSISNNSVLTVVAINSCGNSAPSTLSIVANPNCKASAGVLENVESKFSLNVFPNPSSGQLTVAILSSLNEKIKISVRDLLGQVVYEQYAELISGNNSIELDLSILPKGLYLLNTHNENIDESIRIILE
jgi:hypothetical protein